MGSSFTLSFFFNVDIILCSSQQRQNLNEVENLYFHHSAVTRNVNPRPTPNRPSLLPGLVTSQLPTSLGTPFSSCADTPMPDIQVTAANMSSSDGPRGVRQEEWSGEERIVNDDVDSEIDPRILQEPLTVGVIYADSDQRRGSAPHLLESLHIPELPSTPTPTGRPSPTKSLSKPCSPLSNTNNNLQQPKPTRFQSVGSAALRLSTGKPEVTIPDPPANFTTGSRTGSTSPWSRNRKNVSTNASASSSGLGGRAGNANTGLDANSSNSNTNNNGGNGSGFGNPALTYDSFWSGFRGSTTPTASTTPTSTAHPSPSAARTLAAVGASTTRGTAALSPFDVPGVGSTTRGEISLGQELWLGRTGVVEGGGGGV